MIRRTKFWKDALDEGLDELAATAHAGFPPRVTVNAIAAIVFALMLPWRICAVWGTATLALEAQAWFATRRQFLGKPVGWRTRLWHIAGLGVASLAWITMGGLLWASGTVEGAVSAMIVWLTVVYFAQTNAYQSPLGSVVGGAIPAATIAAIVWLAPSPPLRLLPVGALLMLALAFAAEGVSRLLQMRRRMNETQAQLKRSEALYRVLANNVTDVISLNGVDGERLYVSPSIEQAVGFTPEEYLKGKSYAHVYPEDLSRLARQVSDLSKSGGEMTTEYRVLRADGVPVWVETNYSIAEDPTGQEPKRLISVSRNIQRRKELEAQLIEAREAAESAAAAKSDFLANMTHELRTPLNAIIGFAEVLKDSPRLEGPDARHVQLIREASATLLDLVNSVLDFSRFEAGAVELDPVPFDPTAEARAIVDMMAGQAAAKGLELSLVAGDTPPLTGDAKRLRQVLLNFLSNAIKFTQRGAVIVRLSQAEDEPAARRLRVEVSDTGVGLPESQIAHVFERFTQGDVSVSRKFGGTGLGLAICKRIIDLMGGRIGALSTQGQGSTFWFEVTLPVAAGLHAAAEAPPADLERPVRVLLVEDVAINRELARTILSPFDVEIDSAENGAEAVEAFKRERYDLVLMDVQMPVMDGLTAARCIRALPMPEAKTTPIIAMTANVLPEQVQRCLDAGMDGHLGKPMNPAQLLDTVARWTAEDRSLREAQSAAA